MVGPEPYKKAGANMDTIKNCGETNAFVIEGTQDLSGSNRGKALGEACWEEWGQ